MMYYEPWTEKGMQAAFLSQYNKTMYDRGLFKNQIEQAKQGFA